MRSIVLSQAYPKDDDRRSPRYAQTRERYFWIEY